MDDETRETRAAILERLGAIEANVAFLVSAFQDQGLRLTRVERRATSTPPPGTLRAAVAVAGGRSRGGE